MQDRANHHIVTINNRVYSWGGYRRDMPLVHDNEMKKSLISNIDIFDISTLLWSSLVTTGIPPAAVMYYSCCTIGSKIYMFGGNCIPRDCYHNDLFMMDTLNNKWSPIQYTNSPSTTPMKKYGHGMMSYTSNKKECLLIIGGIGPTPTSPSNGQYIPSSIPNTTFTNEVHSLCLSSSPCSFTVPMVTGTPPPPTAYFTLHNIHLHNKAIMFGGLVYNGNRGYYTNDSYILTVLNDQVEFQQLQYSSVNNCPVGRDHHASTVITTGNDTSYLLVIGGLDSNNDVLNDCWVLNIVIAAWRKINLPDYVSKRFDHSISCLTMTDNSVWVVVNGGFNHINKQEGNGTIITDINTTVLVQLVYSNNDWTVANIYNSEQLIEQRVTIHSNLIQHIVTDQLMNKTVNVSDIITTIQSTNTSRTDDSITRKEVIEEKEEEIKHLKSDLILLKQGYMLQLLNKEKELKTIMKESENVLSKMLLGKTLELESIKNKKVVESCAVKVDFSQQFNYIATETDHLQGIRIFSSKLFTARGDLQHSFVWEGMGFELHLPKGTCLPNDETEIMVDAVIGGDFVFPEGVEPVSAIYIISIASMLRQPSLLKIQHCVALKKASTHSQLSFYRASLKEPTPPYFFKRRKGGIFDINNKYGELELPVFCAMVIGKESTSSSSSNSNDESSDSINDTSSGIVSDIDIQQETDSGIQSTSVIAVSPIHAVDDSIIYHGQLLYLRQNFNKWKMKFVLVKNIDAFVQYVQTCTFTDLSKYETDVYISLTPINAQHTCIELLLNSNDNHEHVGWSILPHSEPCALSLKQANSFGYDKEVSMPPSCLVSIIADKSVPGCVKRLNYPVPLKGAIVGENNRDSRLFLIRELEENQQASTTPTVTSVNVTTPQQDQQLSSPPATTEDVPISDIINCIKGELLHSISDLTELFDTRLEKITTELLAVGLVSEYAVNSHPTSTALIKEYRAGFMFTKTIAEVTEYCHIFFNAVYKVGGVFRRAANSLKKQINDSLMEKFNITLDL